MGFNPDDYWVTKDCPERFEIVHRKTGVRREIRTYREVRGLEFHEQ